MKVAEVRAAAATAAAMVAAAMAEATAAAATEEAKEVVEMVAATVDPPHPGAVPACERARAGSRGGG